MAYTFTKTYKLYTMEQVQKELGIYDLLDWSRLIAGYDLNLKLIECNGYIGMEEDEKNRIVAELRDRLAEMPEIKKSLPAKRKLYPCSRVFTITERFYSDDDCLTESGIDRGILNKIFKSYKPNAKKVDVKGKLLMPEAEKDRIVRELREQKRQIEEEERRRNLDQLAFRQGMTFSPLQGMPFSPILR